MNFLPHNQQRQGGFTMLEVIISVAVLLALTLAAVTLLRSSFDTRLKLNHGAKKSHRIAVAMDAIVKDLTHAYIVPARDQQRNGIGRTVKGMLKFSDRDGLSLTTKTHRPLVAGSNRSDLTFVVYELKDDEKISGRKNLYRGDLGTIPVDFRDGPGTRLLVRNVKSMNFEAWRGDGWTKDGWDTGRGETRDNLPRLVRVTLEFWSFDREAEDPVDEQLEEDTFVASTVVYLVEGDNYKELKQQVGAIPWGKL